jgi:hypothetical protein
VNRFETIQGETTPATVDAMQRALESAGAIFEENSDGLAWISHTICWHWGGESEKVIFGQ